MTEATYFIKGDAARYVGMARSDYSSRMHQDDSGVLCPGDVVTVSTGNLDEDDDVIVNFRGTSYFVSPQDLTWLRSA